MARDEIKTITQKSGSDDDWTRVTGTDVSGNKRALDVAVKEGNVTADVSGTINTIPSGLSTAGQITRVTLSSASWTALPATALTDRNGLGVQNDSGIEIKVGFDSGEAGYVGWTVRDLGEFFVDITDAVTLYAKAASGTPTVTVMEVS